MCATPCLHVKKRLDGGNSHAPFPAALGVQGAPTRVRAAVGACFAGRYCTGTAVLPDCSHRHGRITSSGRLDGFLCAAQVQRRHLESSSYTSASWGKPERTEKSQRRRTK